MCIFMQVSKYTKISLCRYPSIQKYFYAGILEYIWLIFTRTVTPLEIFRWFPQIVFTLLTSVRPINIGFSNRFFVYQIKGFWILLSKENLKKINLRVRFLPLKIAFFGGFENDNILSSKSYTVTKSGISPQRKLGSLQNLKLKFFFNILFDNKHKTPFIW